MKKPTAAQLAARKKFAEMARSGALAKKRKAAVKKTVRAKNPVAKKKTVSQKISQLRHEGYPQKQAVAVALSEKRAGRLKNPVLKMKIRGSETPDNPEGIVVTEAGALRFAKANMPKDLKKAGFVPSVVAGARGWSINYGAAVPGHSSYSKNPTKKTMHMYTVHRTDANGNPVYHIAHFRNLKDAKEYAHAYANAHGKMIAITKKAI